MKKIIKIDIKKLLKNKKLKKLKSWENKRKFRISNFINYKKNISYDKNKLNLNYNDINKKNENHNNKSIKDIIIHKRAVVINNLIKFIKINNHCLNEYTLFRAIIIFDNFIQNQNEMKNYELISKTCLFIANKIDNQIKLNIKNFKINENDIKNMETKITNWLNLSKKNLTLLEKTDYYLLKFFENNLINKEQIFKLKLKTILVLRIILLTPNLLNYNYQIITISCLIYNINLMNYDKNIIKFLLKDFKYKNEVIKFKNNLNKNFEKWLNSFNYLDNLLTDPIINKKSIFN